MSSLSSKLAEVHAPKEYRIASWLRSLPEDDRKAAWAALRDEQKFGPSTLLRIFNEEGAGIGKDSFKKFRAGVLDGTYTEVNTNGS